MLCVHKTIITEEGEVVCTICGCVLGYECSEITESNSSATLFHLVELGCKRTTLDKYKRVYTSMQFSIICDKLELPSYALLEAWSIYNNLKKYSSKSKAAFIAVYNICRKYAIPRTEEEIRSAVLLAYKIKRLPSTLKIMNELVDKIEVEREESDNYYIYLALKRYGIEHNRDLLLKISRIYELLKGSKKTRAERAVKIVVGDKRWRM